MDRYEFEQLYEREFPRLIGQLTVLCGDREEAADCVQEAFVRAWERRRELEASTAPGGWVRTAAVRIATSRWRRARNAASAWQRSWFRERHDDPGPENGDGETFAAMQRLTYDQRHVLALHYVFDMSVADTARVLGLPESTVKVRLHRARRALSGLLAPAVGPVAPPVACPEGA